MHAIAPKHALHRTRPSRPGCNRGFSWAGLLRPSRYLPIPITMRALTFMVLLSMCSCQAKDDAERALDDARRLAEQGDYEGALAKHVWFHDNALKVRPSYYGVRLSFALSAWIELGQKYPQALEKLKSIRDEKTSRLLAGEAKRDLFHDVGSINQHLGEMIATVELFKRMEVANPGFASDIYDLADEALLQAREYALAKKYLGDPTKRLATAKRNFDRGIKYAKTSKSGDASRQAFESIFTDRVVRIITVLRETGDKIGAKNIQTEALETLDNSAIRNALKK
jgi:tetratricopeptide (TPR) repeat protein